MSDARPTDAAIVGMACIFPGAPDLGAYWANLRDGVDAITAVPAARWEPVFYDPDSEAVDRFYCRRGGFVDEHATFDALGWGIMPVAAQGAEPDQLVTLEVAARALADAGYRDRDFDRAKAAVILGRGNYIGAGMTRLEQHVRTAQQLVTSLRELVPGLDDAQLDRVKREFQAKLGGYGPDTAIGLVPNLTASRVANRLDLYGPAYTVDAACASSLVAVDHACRELATGRSDVAIAGGVHLSHDVSFWSVFCQLGALSRSEQIRPFDRGADGLLIGEGVGLVVLKRLEDARKDGDRIYAVLRGTGVASDGRGASLMTPRVEGQRLALERAWEGLETDPGSVGLVEAHGTGTPAGDGAELETVADFFGADGAPGVLGSVKSMIGHAMPAAGAAGLIKAALAIHHRVLPPSLHCEEPHPRLADTRFRVIGEAEPWEGDGRPLRAAVNAFGFGGINGHAVLESEGAPRGERPGERSRRGSRPLPPTSTFENHSAEPLGSTTEPSNADPDEIGSRPLGPSSPDRSQASKRRPAHVERPEEILLLAAESPEALARVLHEGRIGGQGPTRLALVNPTPERRAKAMKAVRSGEARRGRDGLWFAPKGLLTEGGKVAFLFPGVEAVFEPRVDDVAAWFDRPAPPRVPEGDLEYQGAAVVAVGRLLHHALGEAGVRPDVIAGHSVGEWTGMVASGVIPEDALDAFVDTLEAGSLEVPGVVFAAAGAGAHKVEPLIEDLDELVVTHDNCPHQVIVCGPEEQVDVALDRFKEARVLAQKLPFRSGFHSPVFEPYVGTHRAHFEGLPLQAPGTPIWSATTAAPYPEDPDAIRALAVDHLVRPVRFREVIARLHAEGVRAFVQVGTGSLVGFVDDTLRGEPHLAMSANAKQRPGMDQLRRVVAALFVEGADVDWARVTERTTRHGGMTLPLGVPLVEGLSPLDVDVDVDVDVDDAPEGREHPVLSGFHDVLRSVRDARGAVEKAWSSQASTEPRPAPWGGGARPPERVRKRTLSVATEPYLLDHGLIPQREGWPVVADRHPVVPMTMSIRLMLDAADELDPGRVPVAIEGVRAYRWMAVEPPAEITIRTRPVDDERVAVSIEGYIEGTVVLGEGYPAAPEPAFEPLDAPEPVPITARQLYDERWMFHGPGYQAVADLGEIGSDGVDGTLEALEAPGALLDAAGQLFGYWVMETQERDRLAMPIKVARMDLFGPEPGPGTRVVCAVRIRHLGRRNVRADLEMTVGGRLWARIEGWEDWRFDTDDRLWPVMQRTEDHLFADILDEGVAFLHDPKRSGASRDYLARRFLSAEERARREALPEAEQVPWLYARIVARDAVRERAMEEADERLFPVEVALEEEGEGLFRAETPSGEILRVAVAAEGETALAVVAGGRGAAAVLREAPADSGGGPDETVLTDEDTHRLRRVGGRVETRRREGFVIAWTSEGT